MSEPPVWTDADHLRELDLVHKDASERCALLCEMMAGAYDSHAKTLRKEGEYTVRDIWPFGKRVTRVRTVFEHAAMLRENMARTLRLTAACCRAGWDPRSLKITEPAPADVSEWARFQDTV